MKVWFENPKLLFAKNDVAKFWPVRGQSAAERINATSRFVIYLSAVLYAVRRDPRIFVLAALVLSSMYILYKTNMVPDEKYVPVVASGRKITPVRPACQAPTRDNPLANVLLSDYVTDPDRPPACAIGSVDGLVTKYLDDSFPRDAGDVYNSRNGANRAFYSMPSTTIPNDQTAFAEALYGKKFKPTCRSDPSACDPDTNPMFPEEVQMRGLFGGSV
jgi:hypothetical protein